MCRPENRPPLMRLVSPRDRGSRGFSADTMQIKPRFTCDTRSLKASLVGVVACEARLRSDYGMANIGRLGETAAILLRDDCNGPAPRFWRGSAPCWPDPPSPERAEGWRFPQFPMAFRAWMRARKTMERIRIARRPCIRRAQRQYPRYDGVAARSSTRSARGRQIREVHLTTGKDAM